MQIEYDYIDGIINHLSEMNLKDLNKVLTCVSQEIINRIPKFQLRVKEILQSPLYSQLNPYCFFLG